MKHEPESTIGWKQIITAFIVQTVVAGMAFYSATVRWQAQQEERVGWMREVSKNETSKNAEEHRTILAMLEEIRKGIHHDSRN